MPSPRKVGPNTPVLRGIGNLAKASREHARQRIERVGLALLVDDVVEERAECGAGQLGGGIGHHLDGAFEIELGGDRGADLVQELEDLRFLLQEPRALRARSRQLDIGRDARQQLARAERLDEIVVGAHPQAFDLGFLAGARRQDDHRHAAQLGIGAQLLQQPEAVEPRHHDVGEDQIGTRAPRCRQRLLAVGGGGDLVARRRAAG